MRFMVIVKADKSRREARFPGAGAPARMLATPMVVGVDSESAGIATDAPVDSVTVPPLGPTVRVVIDTGASG